jgi:hypothetical protein
MDVGKESDPVVIGRQSPEIFDKGWAPKGSPSTSGVHFRHRGLKN